MKNYMRLLIEAVNERAEEIGLEELLEELFPGMSVGEVVGEMYEAGLIPEDVIENYL